MANGNRMRCNWVDGVAEGKGEIWVKETRTKKPAEWINGKIVE